MPNSGLSSAIVPATISFPQQDLDDLRTRLRMTRWPDEISDAGWEYGIPLATAKSLAEYWLDGYDWRLHERTLNDFPQYTTTIDGACIHFLHIRSAEANALPLIITHGWPGSVIEFLRVIGPLTDPVAHGGSAADAFHLVIPSIPGFGFSGPTTEKGWGVRRVAEAWNVLMARLGYERYGAQGGDWGSRISRVLGEIDPEHVVGTHVNFLRVAPPTDPVEIAALSTKDQAAVARMAQFEADGRGYSAIQGTRPQTLAYALVDSPVGQLAWIAEKFEAWSDPSIEIDRDWLLTNVTIYWLTRTAGSSARLYLDFRLPLSASEPALSSTPLGVAIFPHEIVPPIRSIVERTHNVVHWSEFDRGGHFAAVEVPELLVGDVRKFFRELR
jgi:microsomal epoxide hydrolase